MKGLRSVGVHPRPPVEVESVSSGSPFGETEARPPRLLLCIGTAPRKPLLIPRLVIGLVGNLARQELSAAWQ